MKRRLPFTLAIGVCVGIACLAASSDDTNTLPIAKIAETGGVAVTNAGKGTTPSIVFVRTRSEALSGGKVIVAELVLVNPLDVPIRYYGYSMDSWQTRPPAGEIHPFCSRRVKEGEEWKDAVVGKCGTGAADMKVPPKNAGRFEVMIQLPGAVTRVGFGCLWTTADGKKVEQIIWSDDIQPE